MAVYRLPDRRAPRLEISDRYVSVDAELLVYQRGANDPRIVGEADDVAARRSSDGNGHCARQRTTLLSLEILPCGLKARMVPGVQRRCFAERHDAPALDLGDREARVRAPNVDRDDL